MGANKVSNGGYEERVGGKVAGYNSEVTDEDFVQPRMFWQVLGHSGPIEQRDLVNNICGHPEKPISKVQKDAVAVFAKVDASWQSRLKGAWSYRWYCVIGFILDNL